MVKKPNAKKRTLSIGQTLGSTINTRKGVKIIDGMTLGGGKEATMLSKEPWVLDKVVGSIISTEKGMKIINGMTQVVEKKPQC